MMNMTVKRAETSSATEGGDAIAMLVADHKKVKDIFKQFETLKKSEAGDDEKRALVTQACRELKIHMTIEEEIFYPAIQKAIDDNDMLDEAYVEHAGAKELIAQLEAMKPSDPLYDAKMTVLGENIEHHVKEEEAEMFPKARKAKLDLTALGSSMSDRKSKLMAEGCDAETGEGRSAATAWKSARSSVLLPVNSGR